MSINFSPRFFLVLVSTHLIAAIIVYAAVVPFLFKLSAILLVVFSLVYYLARDVFILLPISWRAISLEQNGVTVTVRNGSSFPGKITDATIVTPYCIIIRIRLDRHYLLISRVIFPDSLSQGEFRDLSVGLRFS